MILCHPEIERVFDLSTKKIPSLVVEKPSFFRKLVLDLYEQCDGGEGEFLLSENDVILNMYSNVEFIDNSVHYDFTPKALELAADIRSEEYYINMMTAWFFATALAKQYEAAVPYIEQRRLAPWTHNKTIRKAIESCRITEERKAYLRTLTIRE